MSYGKQGNQKVGKRAKTTGNGHATKEELLAKLEEEAKANKAKPN